MCRKIFFICLIGCLTFDYGRSQIKGLIKSNTNLALPSSYNFQEYVFAEPNDQGTCLGINNTTAVITEVFMAQTHRHAIGHPLFFTVGHRPALLQVAVTGTGSAPDVRVVGRLNGVALGSLCLKGPASLSGSINLSIPDFDNYFSVTLPKAWVQPGLELTITVGNNTRVITNTQLNIGPYTEMNLVMVKQDVMDFNTTSPRHTIFKQFLAEMASAIPASVIRFGIFPATLVYPEVVANNNKEQLARLVGRGAMQINGVISEGSINSIASLALGNLHKSTGDYLSTVYFGNTLNLSPGGWGGGKSFVGFDYTDIFIHELGHALSLPHWGEGSYKNPNSTISDFLYPYGGKGDNGGGRGQAWNFIQDLYEFEDPICRTTTNTNLGAERSDCMQRNNPCLGTRKSGLSPWDGYGDFSAYAIHRYLIGADVLKGKVQDNNTMKDFQFNRQFGFPIMSLQNGKRIYTRYPQHRQELTFEERIKLPGQEKLEQDVYLIYGSAHETQSQANIVYKPIKFKGTLPPIIDPTDTVTMAQLKGETYLPYLFGTRDITIKLTYEDGSVLHALNPFHSYERAPYTRGYNIWRNDVCNFSLVVPADKNLIKAELYKRPFCIRYANDTTRGNINYMPYDITAKNYMKDAIFQAKYEIGQAKALALNSIGNRVWHDLNQNGKDDNNEKGIAGVTLLLWKDSNADDKPDHLGFGGSTKTDTNGFYSFSGLIPGNYLVFVWFLENYEAGKPLYNMVPTKIYVHDPNTDINHDNNGRPGNLEWPGLGANDIASGLITLTKDGEPINDGDKKDDWFDYDKPGNMTIDFGFHIKGAIVSNKDKTTIEVKLYPNPFNEKIVLELKDYKGHLVQFADLHGRLLFSTLLQSSITSIPTSEISSGIFIMILKNKIGEIVSTKKFIKH